MKDITPRRHPPSAPEDTNNLLSMRLSMLQAWGQVDGINRASGVVSSLTNLAGRIEELWRAVEQRDLAAISALEVRHRLLNIKERYTVIDNELAAEKQRSATALADAQSLEREKGWQRKLAEAQAKQAYDNFTTQGGTQPSQPTPPRVPNTQDEAELCKDNDQLQGVMSILMENAARRAEYVRKHSSDGTEEGLSAEHKAVLKRLDDMIERMVKESGYG